MNATIKRLLSRLAGGAVAGSVTLMRLTCRVCVHNDPRPRLTSLGLRHVFATLHAQQINGMLCADRGTGAMVSRSDDGEIVIPSLRVCGHIPVRGSSGRGKGGATALHGLIDLVKAGHPAMIACDGPRGPRGKVHQGIAMLAAKSDAVVLPVVAIPSRRWILAKTWDRLQVPMPFSTIHVYVAAPMQPMAGESKERFAKRIEISLNQLEYDHDPGEGTQPTGPASETSVRVAA